MKIKSNMIQKSVYLLSFFALLIGSSASFVALSPESVSAAAAKCYFYGELTDSKKGTISLSCDTIREEYKKLAGDSFSGFKANTCYMLSDLPRPSAKKTDCAKAEKAVEETESAGSTVDEPVPTAPGDCGGAETSIIKCDADNSGGIENNGVWALLLMAINILTAGIGIAAIGGIVYGSILYTTAGDNESQIKSAKEIIRNVIVGLVAYIGMFALLQFIIPGGVFS